MWHDVTQWRMDHVLQTDEYVRPKTDFAYNLSFVMEVTATEPIATTSQ